MYYSTARHRLQSHLPMWLAAALMLLACCGPVSATMLRWAPSNTSQQVKPIVVYAGNIATWTEKGFRYFYLQDKAWISQGIVNIRFKQGLIRVDETRKQQAGIYHLDIYAEEAVSVEDGPSTLKNDQAHLQLTTKGDVKLKAYNGNVITQSLAASPVTQRGLAAFAGPEKLPPVSPPGGTPPATISLATPNANVPPITPPPAPIPGAIKTNSGPAAQLGQPTSKSLTPALFAPQKTEKNPIQLVGGQSLPPVPPGPPAGAQPIPLPPPAQVGPSPLIPNLFSGEAAGDKIFSIRPRSSFQELQVRNFVLPSGETAVVVSSGVLLTVTNADGKGGILDIEADQLVFWTQGNPQQIIEDLRQSKSQKHRSLEFYMAGHVEIRTQGVTESRVLRAEEVYYDVNRHVAIANNADLELADPRLLNPIHLQAAEVLQLNSNLFQANQARVNASVLPYDPGLTIAMNEATIEMKQITRQTIFGFPIVDRVTGQPIVDTQRYFKGRSVFLELEDIPIFYLPFLQGDAEDPLGPLQNFSVGYNRIFGAQIQTTWDMYDLIGTTAIPGTRWRLLLDVLTDRGPAIGSDFTFQGENLFNIPNRYNGLLKAYGMYDGGEDIIGGDRGRSLILSNGNVVPVTHPELRGRFLGRLNLQDLPSAFTLQTQISAISDRNFLEQYYLQEWLNDLNQETFLYVKQQEGNWAWTGLIEPRIRPWITETEWLPRFDGYLLGMSFFDVATYNLKASAGYAELEPTDQPPFAYFVTDQDTNTGRFDLWQELSIPLAAGPVKVVPYGIVDLTYYTEDLTGNDRGRIYGAGGVRAAMPLSRLYADACSELFNVDGIFHKVTLHGNFYTAYSDTSYQQLPQLDRLNDDASDQALRNLFPQQKFLNPNNATALTLSPLFNPQEYALRRLVLNRIDTRDDIEVVQVGIDQRWQTKRGFPGRQHIIDWMTLYLSASLFPRADRDNFGETAAFLEYDWTWNIGDRTSLVSNGWVDPIDDGPRVFNFGAYLNRPNNTTVYLGYRQIDPLQSKSVIGALTYDLSRKYAVTASANYDFGVENQVTSLILTRRGKDLRVSFGLTYNSILNNFGVVFEVVPNLLPASIRAPGVSGPFTSSITH